MKKAVNKTSKGCIVGTSIVIVAIIIFSVLQSYIPIGALPNFVLSYIISSFLVTKISDSSNPKRAKAKAFRYIILGFLVIGGFVYIKNSFLKIQMQDADEPIEVTTSEVLKENNKDVKVISHFRKWRDNYGNKYQGKLSVREHDYLFLKGNINGFKAKTRKHFWYDLYGYMYKQNKNKLDLLYTTFAEIKKKHALDQRTFAEMVVTAVQDIPYALVLETTCAIKNIDQEQLKQVLQKCSTCCIGNVTYGVQQPTAFIGNLKGDCDTRTVLIFTILAHFGYDVAILNSNYYRHSVLGLHIPAAGLYKAYNGKKYYLWETTSKHFKLGYLSKNVNNVVHWNVIITSK